MVPHVRAALFGANVGRATPYRLLLTATRQLEPLLHRLPAFLLAHLSPQHAAVLLHPGIVGLGLQRAGEVAIGLHAIHGDAVAGGVKRAQFDLRFVITAIGSLPQDIYALGAAFRQTASLQITLGQAQRFIGLFERRVRLYAPAG